MSFEIHNDVAKVISFENNLSLSWYWMQERDIKDWHYKHCRF